MNGPGFPNKMRLTPFFFTTTLVCTRSKLPFAAGWFAMAAKFSRSTGKKSEMVMSRKKRLSISVSCL